MRPVVSTPVRTLPRPGEGSPGFAALLSALLPGLGQLYQERWVRGALMVLLPPLFLVLLIGFTLIADPVAATMVRRAALVAILLVGGLFVYHVTVVADAFAGQLGRGGLRGRHAADVALLLAIVLGLSALYLAAYRHSVAWAAVIGAVFEPSGRTIAAGTPIGGTTAPGWSGRERLNVLLLGIDRRGTSGETQNTDTIILVSLDPAGRTAAMLSIPRDTLVEIPGVGQDKVNSAFAHGGPDRGPELARRTVERFLAVPIHSYAIVDFNAFRQTIDSVGGVLVDARRPLRDEDYPTPDYGVERVRFLAGPQLMDGEEALKYARSRHDSNDFSRARRQQAVLLALRARLAQAGIFRFPGIAERVGPLVRTSFDPSGVLPLARTALAIDAEDIQSEVLLPCGGDEPHCELTEEGSEAGYYLIPDVEKVRALLSDLFAGRSPASAR